MISWLAKRLKSVGNEVEKLTSAVWDAFKALWNSLYALGLNLMREWVANAHLAIRAVPLIVAFLSSVYQTLKWTFTSLVPHFALDALHKAIRWAGREIALFGRLVDATFNRVLKLIARTAESIARRIADVVIRLTSRIIAIEVTLAQVVKLAFDLLRHPDRLAAFAFGALWRLFWRTAERSAVTIARWLFRRLVPVMLAEIHLIERVLADLF